MELDGGNNSSYGSQMHYVSVIWHCTQPSAGPLDTAKSTCSWKHGTNVLQIFSKLEIFINQMDSYGNLVPEIHPFDAGVVERASNLSVPVVDLLIEVVAEGVQLLSFKLVEPGEFVLTMFDARLNQRIPNMVYIYDVFVGMLA